MLKGPYIEINTLYYKTKLTKLLCNIMIKKNRQHLFDKLVATKKVFHQVAVVLVFEAPQCTLLCG